MSLILIKPKAQKIAGMSHAVRDLTPGAPPPLVVPHCRKCGIPVDKFEIDPISSIFYLGIEAECHGVTGGRKVPAEEAIKSGIVWMFPG